MYQKNFTVILESAFPFPDDLYNKSDWRERIQEDLDEINWIFPDTKKVWVTVK